MFLAGTHATHRHSWCSLGCRHSESCVNGWNGACGHSTGRFPTCRCQVTLSLGEWAACRALQASWPRPGSSWHQQRSTGGIHCSSSLWLRGWLAGIIPKAEHSAQIQWNSLHCLAGPSWDGNNSYSLSEDLPVSITYRARVTNSNALRGQTGPINERGRQGIK